MISVIKSYTPWWMKIVSKIILSRIPIQHKVWRRVGLFQHGYMHSPQYAYSVFIKHFQHAKLKSNFVCLEMGPGDSLFSGLIAKALGAEKTFLIDVSDYSNRDMSLYKVMYRFLLERGYNFYADMSSFENLLHSCRTTYMTSGLSSLKEIPDKSVDFIFSQAVLEHIRKGEFGVTLRELYRILKPTRISSHVIDLRDHLGGALNNLSFSELIWESDFFAKSGFYTNRIRFFEMLDLFKKTGFQSKIIGKEMWTKLPTPRNRFHKKFRQLSEQDLSMASFTILLWHQKTSKTGNVL